MIGVFDSGYGGLTVLRALVGALPERTFLYLGDHAAAPYGNRSQDEIFALTRIAVERLFGLGCRLVVLACNTAAAIALRRLQQEWLPTAYPGNRVLGVLVPMVEVITGMSWMADLPAARRHPKRVPARTVAVFATRQTVLSNAYPVEIGKRAPEVTVIQQACPNLASLIEQGVPRPAIGQLVQGYVETLMQRMNGLAPDLVMLGCTHYPLVIDLFEDALPDGTEILSQPDLVARSLVAYLRRHPELDDRQAPASVRFFTSGDPKPVSRLGSVFYGSPVSFSHIRSEISPRQTAGLVKG